ncbi:MAG: hypothetical protein MUC61_00600 [Amoebophilaceae bacterium]|jgi:hypothetical protein|nr:hypothetical protein [Amoebophilaceae bacterium]
MRQVFLALACFSVSYSVLGQRLTPQGAFKDAEFIIEKEYKHLLPEASRLFERAPTAPFMDDSIKSLEYVLPDLCPEFDILPCKTRILRTKRDTVTRLYGNCLQSGYGNFRAPFLEAVLANKDHAKYAYGLQMRHLSNGKDAFFEETHNLIRLHGKWFLETLRLEGEIAYSGDKYPLYNAKNSTVAASPSQVLHQFSVRKTLANYVHSTFDFRIDALFHGCYGVHQARENQWECHGSSHYVLNDAWTLKVFIDLYCTQYRDKKVVHRNLGRFNPVLDFTINEFDVQAGCNLVYQNDVSHIVNSLNAYPVLEVKYAFRKWLQPYCGISGDVQQNFLQSFLRDNPLLAPEADLRHTNQRFIFYGGGRGDIVGQVDWHAGLSVGTYQNFYCLVNSDQDPGRFDIRYDPAVTLFNTFCELTHTNLAETLTTRLRGDYFYYALQKLPKPWHRPRYQIELLSTYRLYDKVGLRGSMCWLGGIEAWDVTARVPVALTDVVDVRVGLDYWLGTRFVVVFNCQNLLARSNERYLYYPSRGFHFMAGLMYTW